MLFWQHRGVSCWCDRCHNKVKLIFIIFHNLYVKMSLHEDMQKDVTEICTKVCSGFDVVSKFESLIKTIERTGGADDIVLGKMKSTVIDLKDHLSKSNQLAHLLQATLEEYLIVDREELFLEHDRNFKKHCAKEDVIDVDGGSDE